MKSILIALTLLHNISFAQTSDFVDMSEETTVSAESPSQASDLGDQKILEEIVRRYTVDLIGEKKYEENINIIRARVIKESGKFVPLMKPNVESLGNGQYKVSVILKVSPTNLRQLLEKTGILASQYNTGVVLPFITFVDEIRAKIYKWWVGDTLSDDFINSLNNKLFLNLQNHFKEINYYLMNPVQWDFKKSLPPSLEKDYFRKGDYQFVESYFDFPMVIRGQVLVSPSSRVSSGVKFQVKLEVILNSQAKTIAEATRSLELDSNDMQSAVLKNADKLFSDVGSDLREQIESALKKGILESSVMNITLRGDLNFKNLENFKSTVLKSIGSIRSLTERYVESDKRVFEIDYTGNIQALAKKIEALKYQGIKVTTQDVSSKNIDVKISN